MKRSFPALIAAAAIALGGCATFTDADVAARVGDEELSEDELADLVRGLLDDPTTEGIDDTDVVPMAAVNQVVTNFVLFRVLTDDLETAGKDAPDVPEGGSFLDGLDSTITTWQTEMTPRLTRDDLAETYALGPAASGIACTAHILVEDEATANTILERLESGDDFGELAAEFSIDPGSGASGGELPCSSTSEFSQTYIPEYVNATLNATVGVPVGPIESQFGFHVIVVRPLDDLTDIEIEPFTQAPDAAQEAFDLALDGADVYVNPRYGAFDPTQGVVPLG